MDFDEDSSNTREASCTPPLPTTDLTPNEIMKFGPGGDDLPTPERMPSPAEKEDAVDEALLESAVSKVVQQPEPEVECTITLEAGKNGDQNAVEKGASKGEKSTVETVEKKSSPKHPSIADEGKRDEKPSTKMDKSQKSPAKDKTERKSDQKEPDRAKHNKSMDREQDRSKDREKTKEKDGDRETEKDKKAKHKDRDGDRSKEREKKKVKEKDKKSAKRDGDKRKDRKDRSPSRGGRKKRDKSKSRVVRSKVEVAKATATEGSKKSEERFKPIKNRKSRSRERDKKKSDDNRGSSPPIGKCRDLDRKKSMPRQMSEEQAKINRLDSRERSLRVRSKERLTGGNLDQFGRFDTRRNRSVTPVQKHNERSPGSLSALKYTSSLPVISWRERIVKKTPIRPALTTPAIAALQAYDDSDSSQAGNEPSKKKSSAVVEKSKKKKDASEKVKSKSKDKGILKKSKHGSSHKKKSKDKRKEVKKRKRLSPEKKKKKEKTKKLEEVHTKDSTDTEMDVSLPEDELGEEEEEEQIIKLIKLEKLDERDALQFQNIEIDYSIVKQEPLTDEEKEKEKEVSAVSELEAEVPPEIVPENVEILEADKSLEQTDSSGAFRPKFSCSFLDDLNSTVKLTIPESMVNLEKAELEDRNRRETDSPDTDDYASNWENDEFDLLIANSKTSVGTPTKDLVKTLAVEEDGTRMRFTPKSSHEQIIPLDDLLNIQSQLQSMKSKMEQAEQLENAAKSEENKLPASTGDNVPEKLASEYQNFIQLLDPSKETESNDVGKTDTNDNAAEKKKSGKRRASSSTTTSTSSTSESSSSSTDSSSTSSSSSSSSSSSDSSSDSSDEEKVGNKKKKKLILVKRRKKKFNKPIIPVEDIEKLASELRQPDDDNEMGPEPKPVQEFTPPKTPPFVIPEHLLPKIKSPVIPLSTPPKIYNIRDDSMLDTISSQESIATAIKPLNPDRDSPFKLKLPSKNKIISAITTAALLGPEDEDGEAVKKENKKEDHVNPLEPSREKSRSKEDRHGRKRSRERKSKDRSPKRVRGRSAPPRKRRSKDRRSLSKSKEQSPIRKLASLDRDRERRKDRSHQSRSSPPRRIKSPPPPPRRRRTRSRSRSLSPAVLRRPPSPPAERSPRRFSADREWRRSRSPYYQRPPSPKEKPPTENQIDVVTSSGAGQFASRDDQSPVAGYKKSLADSTISDAELENQKRKTPAFSESSAYNNVYSKTYGFYDPQDMVLEGPEGGDSPRRIPLDDRINIVLGMNGTEVPKRIETTSQPPPADNYGDYQPIQTVHHDIRQSPQQPQHQQYPAQFAGTINTPRPMAHPQHYPSNYPQEYHHGAPPPQGPPGPPGYVYNQGPRPPFYPGPRGPQQSWQHSPHPSMQPIPSHVNLYQNNMYHHNPIAPTPPPPLPVEQSSKSLVKQVGNMLEIVPTAVPPPVIPLKITPPPTPVEPHILQSSSFSVQPSPSATPITLPPPTSLILVAPKAHTAEELKLRHERRLELKKKIRIERDKRRMEKKMRKEKLKMEVKRLLADTASVANVSSSDEEFDAVKHQELLTSLKRSYDKSILRTKTGACVARKKVLFADGVAPGDESSSSGAEALRSPAKLAASKTRKRLRRKRTLKATGKKRLIDRLKLPDLNLEEKERVDPELESMPAPPPPPGSPPPGLPQARCINPPPVQMIDFRDAPPMLPFRSSSGSSTPSGTPSSSGSSMPPSAYPPATPPSNNGNNPTLNTNHNMSSHGGPPAAPGASSGMYRPGSMPPNVPPHMRSHHHHSHHYHPHHSSPLPSHSHLPPQQSGMPGMSPGGLMKKPRRDGYRSGPPPQLSDSTHPIETIGTSGPPMRHSVYEASH